MFMNSFLKMIQSKDYKKPFEAMVILTGFRK